MFSQIDPRLDQIYNTNKTIVRWYERNHLTMANLGFVGLGLMGSRIVKRLPDAGHSVSGYNRTQAKADQLIASGMQWCDTPREVAQAADITFSMIRDTAALSSVQDFAVLFKVLARLAGMNEG